MSDGECAHMRVDLDSYVDGEDLRGQRFDEYVVEAQLGAGSSSRVWLAEHHETKQRVALKFTRRGRRGGQADREARLLSLFAHPNIVGVRRVIETASHVVMVMEASGPQCLLHHVLAADFVDESTARGLFRQLLSAVAYMHANCVVPRALSLDKVMVNPGNGHVQLTSLRHAVPVMPGARLESSCAAPEYAAPETLVADASYDGRAADVWALGVSLYIMVCGQAPFSGHTGYEVRRSVLAGPPSLPAYLTDEAQDLLRGMLARAPNERISVAGILDHAWLALDGAPPVELHVRTRPDTVREPHVPTVELLRSRYGFDAGATLKALGDAGCVATPAVCAYHLLEDQRLESSAEEAPLIDL